MEWHGIRFLGSPSSLLVHVLPRDHANDHARHISAVIIIMQKGPFLLSDRQRCQTQEASRSEFQQDV